MPDRTKRIAIVTGGSSGIGAATSLALADAGWTVVLAGRRADRLTEVAEQSRQRGGTADPVVTDVTQELSVEALFKHVAETYGRLDLLFNNAGTATPEQEIDEIDLAAWNHVIAVNVTGMFLCARAAFTAMRQQSPRGGRIINNGSISAHAPRPLSLAYTASKHAVSGMTQSLSLDGRKYDIACGQIDIGNAATQMAANRSGGVLQADGALRPEPTMDVSNVANAVVHMAGLPLSANIAEMTILATSMPYVGRG